MIYDQLQFSHLSYEQMCNSPVTNEWIEQVIQFWDSKWLRHMEKIADALASGHTSDITAIIARRGEAEYCEGQVAQWEYLLRCRKLEQMKFGQITRL